MVYALLDFFNIFKAPYQAALDGSIIVVQPENSELKYWIR